MLQQRVKGREEAMGNFVQGGHRIRQTGEGFCAGPARVLHGRDRDRVRNCRRNHQTRKLAEKQKQPRAVRGTRVRTRSNRK